MIKCEYNTFTAKVYPITRHSSCADGDSGSACKNRSLNLIIYSSLIRVTEKESFDHHHSVHNMQWTAESDDIQSLQLQALAMQIKAPPQQPIEELCDTVTGFDNGMQFIFILHGDGDCCTPTHGGDRGGG